MKNDSDRRILEKILAFDNLENRDVLEIGCGNGRITCLMAGKPKNLTAIEPDPEKIREAREKIPGVDFRRGSGEKLAFAGNSFDLVIFTLSLHHQRSEAALSEAARVLRKDGRALIIEPVNEGEIERLFSLLQDETHEVLLAKRAVDGNNLHLEKSEEFTAEWIFEDKEDLLQSVFHHYNMPFDDQTATRITEFLGKKLENTPVVLQDSMVIHVLYKSPPESNSEL